MERLTAGNCRSLIESYVSIYDNGTGDLQEQENIQEFLQVIDELIEEGYDLSKYTYDELYEEYLSEGGLGSVLKTVAGKALKAGGSAIKTAWQGTVKSTKTGPKYVPGAKETTKEILARTGKIAPLAGLALGVDQALTGGKGREWVGHALQKGRESAGSIPSPNQPQTAKPQPEPAQPEKPKSLKILGGKVVGYNHFDPFDVVDGHLLDEGRDFALQGGKPGFTVKDSKGTRWVPIDTKTFDKAQLDKLTADYTRRRGSAQIEKDVQAHNSAKSAQDAKRSSEKSTPSAATPATTPPKPEASKSTPAPAPSPKPEAAKPKSTSSASASTTDKIKGGMGLYKQQIKTGNIKGAEETGKSTWALANQKLASAAAEKARIRGTQQTDNPLMKDMRSRLPMNSPSVQAPAVAELGKGNKSLSQNPNAFKAATPSTAKSTATPTTMQRNLNLKQSYDYEPYDILLDYLICDGHADTIEEAHYIMLEMDESAVGAVMEQYEDYLIAEEVSEWVDSLLDEGYDLSEYSWDDIVEYYVNEARQEEGESDKRKRRIRRSRLPYDGGKGKRAEEIRQQWHKDSRGRRGESPLASRPRYQDEPGRRIRGQGYVRYSDHED